MQKASVWAEKVMIPTYEIGEAEKNPIFLEKLKKLFIDRLVANIDDEPSRDKYGFLVFVHALASGLIELYTLYLKSEIDLSLAQINEEINKMFLAGLRLYQ